MRKRSLFHLINLATITAGRGSRFRPIIGYRTVAPLLVATLIGGCIASATDSPEAVGDGQQPMRAALGQAEISTRISPAVVSTTLGVDLSRGGHGGTGGLIAAGASADLLLPTRKCAPVLQPVRVTTSGFAVPADYDGDGKIDLAVKDDSWSNAGWWYIDHAANGFGTWDGIYVGSGGPDAIPVPADYDGDCKADLAVKDNASGNWKIDYAADGFELPWNEIHAGYGGPDAIPVPADYDGDGKADLSVKSDGGEWFIDYAFNGFGTWDARYSAYGFADAHPVPADYDGDGKADLSVKTDEGQWYIDYASNGFGSWDAQYSAYGFADAHPVPADYDGDGKADLSVKADGGQWYIDYASNGFGSWDVGYSAYGFADAHPVPADYDGDGETDLSVNDGSQVYIDYAIDGFGAWNQIVKRPVVIF